MKEDDLETALDQIASDKASEKSEGIKHLTRILDQGRKTSKLDSLNDRGFHEIFESLFQFVKREKAVYSSQSAKPTPKNASGSRLSTAASALRVAIEIGVPKIRLKTVNAVIDHVLDCLPDTTGEIYCPPLSIEYLKCVRNLLQHPSHLEHLREVKKAELIDFYLSGLSNVLQDQGASVTNLQQVSGTGSMISSTQASRNAHSAQIRVSQRSDVQKSWSESTTITDELVLSIGILSTSSRCVPFYKFEEIVHVLFSFLSSTSTSTQTQQTAFQAVNNILKIAIIERTLLAREIVDYCLPLIARLWHIKSSSLRDEMLVTLLLGIDTLKVDPCTSLKDDGLQAIENIVESFQIEHSRRKEKDLLQADDLQFFSSEEAPQMTLASLGPHCDSDRSISKWVFMKIWATLISVLDSAQSVPPPRKAKDDEDLDKRRRVARPIDDLLRNATILQGSSRVQALQLVPHLLSCAPQTARQFVDRFDEFLSGSIDDNASVSSWSMIAIACFAYYLDLCEHPKFEPWPKVWMAAARNVAVPACSRAACFLLSTILRLDLLNTSDAINLTNKTVLSNGLSSLPPSLTDSSMALYQAIVQLHLRASHDPENRAVILAIHWVSAAWIPGSLGDRIQTRNLATNVTPAALLNLLSICSSRENSFLMISQVSLESKLLRTWLDLEHEQDLTAYLLLKNPSKSGRHALSVSSPPRVLIDEKERSQVDSLILQTILSKLKQVIEAWERLRNERASNPNPSIVRVIACLCTVARSFVTVWRPSLPSLCSEVIKCSNEIWHLIDKFLAQVDFESSSTYGASIISSIALYMVFRPSSGSPPDAVQAMIASAADLLHRNQSNNGANESPGDASQTDTVGLEQSFTSESSQANRVKELATFVREHITDSSELYFSTTAVLAQLLISNVHAGTFGNDRPAERMRTIDFLVSLDADKFCEARNAILKFLANTDLDRSEACRLLKYMGEELLQPYAFERCEATLCLCVEVLTVLTQLWVNEIEDELSETALELYQWFTEDIVGRGYASPRLLQSITRLLQRVMRINPNFSSHPSGPSPRTILFQLLGDDNNAVKYEAGKIIPGLFGQFVLIEHAAMFSDVLQSLPSNSSNVEGLALKLHVLARLSQRWHTIRHATIYHIVEISATEDRAVPYARYCLDKIARELQLQDVHELFRLFSSQLLDNWLKQRDITAIPFAIFDYDCLQDLLEDAADEVVAQVTMRGNDALLQTLSETMHSSPQTLLSSAFPKVEAYCLARDISVPPSEETKGKSTESIMRKRLGTELADSLTKNHFVEIVTSLILAMDQEQQIDKAFSKRTEYATTRDILSTIDQNSSSALYIAPSHRPSFRAKYILDELDFLCKRVALDKSSLWTPSMTVYVIRKLIDSVNPALGPFHACAILRKIKLVIGLSGSIACDGYPLEQLLRSIQPFVTDFYTSPDAIGLFKYLLTEGKRYLEQNPSFLSGLIISTFMALKDFLASSQDSTTQESLFKEVVSSAESFRQWFIQFLSTSNLNIAHDSERSFGRIVQAASNAKDSSNATDGTYEGSLLQTLLNDQSSPYPLLVQPTFDAAIENLCGSFSRPTKFGDDFANGDFLVSKYASVLWHVVNRTKIKGNFRLWTAQVLGKAYASSGLIYDFLTDEHSRALFTPEPSDQADGHSSNVAIVRRVMMLLSSKNQIAVGVAERTLQSIVGKVADDGGLEPYASILGIPLLTAMNWIPLPGPRIKFRHPDSRIVDGLSCWDSGTDVTEWASRFGLNLAIKSSQNPTISGLTSILYELPEIASELLPYLVHSCLAAGHSSRSDLSPFISQTFRDAVRERSERCRLHLRLILSTVLYLRKQPYPHEATIVDREKWIELDVTDLAATAALCRMYKSALMMLEMQTPQNGRLSRRSSLPKIVLPSELLQEIFENLEDPDYFYGLQQDASVSSVMKKLEYERSGFRALSFQSAQFNSDLKMNSSQGSTVDISGLIGSLTSADFDGLASSLFRSSRFDSSRAPEADLAQAPLNLHEWDIPTSFSSSSSGALFKALASINKIRDDSVIPPILDESLGVVFDNVAQKNTFGNALHEAIGSLAALSELQDIWYCHGKDELEEIMDILQSRNNRTQIESFDRVSGILATREAMFSSFRSQPHLQERMGISKRDAHFLEVTAVRETLRMSRKLEAAQSALNGAIYLSRLVTASAEVGLDIQVVSSLDLAKVLWDHGEKTTSVRILQDLCEHRDLPKQTIPVSRAQLLADLGHLSSEARLEDPQETIDRYLLPAIKELKGNSEGVIPGQVYHEFASYCDKRLQNPDDQEDFVRIEKLRSRKEQELGELERMIEEANGKQKEALKYHLNKAKPWFKLDDQEFQRLKKIRESLISQSLENYLLTLKACDNYDNDVLRFCALWLDQSHRENANTAVSKRIHQIASRKFVPLMNQLSSRLQSTKDSFQLLLFQLITRICRDHPHHGMYQIFATSKARHGREEAAVSRHAAANKIAESLHKDSKTSSLWVAVHNASSSFIKFANEKLEDKKQGKFPIRSLSSGQRMEAETLQVTTRLPPPTLKIGLRADCDYSTVPRIAKYDANFSIASGVSAPKIVTLVASDGKRYKQLFKGGNDDLRQDAIMEQVFEQVSNLLKEHRETRRRKLGIRTYKVLPLHTNAGIIEFVSNTIPLHDYLLPAHQRYHPKDMKPNACRKAIADVDKRSTEHRIQVFRKVSEKFSPVMRYFFFERFPNPDEWFVKRLAYSRTTAAISILGHVLGLGDRHGHNILLDETTGEVVHIDLGVAFEAGRVLPVPEVVPFRLTRDLVDGMGITGTEGVFRRCCNFTLEALRKESYSIMTVLDVLRYDPLYSWSLSPLRIRRIQQENETAAAEGDEAKAATRSTTNTGLAGAKKQDVNEPSEADRALTVVAKKLGKSLSVEATVNELIQQARDERNLAVLYCGWAAYA